MTHAISVHEASLAVARVKVRAPSFGLREVEEFCWQATPPHRSAETSAALDAFARYGEGRHSAGLNMGDCFSYARARLRGTRLLYNGEDFALTDIERA